MTVNDQEILSLIKKYVYICGQAENEHLSFRHVSTKRNKKDYKKIKAFVEEK